MANLTLVHATMCDGSTGPCPGDDLVAMFASRFQSLSWRGRSDLLGEIHDYIAENICSIAEARTCFESVTRQLIERCDCGAITCLDQAFVYLGSSLQAHRDEANLWLVGHGEAGRHLACGPSDDALTDGLVLSLRHAAARLRGQFRSPVMTTTPFAESREP